MTQAEPTSSATVATDRPQRYGKQLVSHMSRKATGTWNDEAGSGVIEFATGRADLSCGDGALLLHVQSQDGDLERLEQVVGRHLVRFGTRDELVVSWTRSDGSAGSEQRQQAE